MKWLLFSNVSQRVVIDKSEQSALIPTEED